GKWFNPANGARDFKSMPEDALAIVARNSESFARFCWEPYLHNPKLLHRLQRVTVPALFVWGENDGIVTPAYGRACADRVRGAKFLPARRAGPYPPVDRPKPFLGPLRTFLV